VRRYYDVTCNLMSAIMKTPVQGVIGIRAKLRLLRTGGWDARNRTDLGVCMQSILDGLNRVSESASV
jgi:hypothetical protein